MHVMGLSIICLDVGLVLMLLLSSRFCVIYVRSQVEGLFWRVVLHCVGCGVLEGVGHVWLDQGALDGG